MADTSMSLADVGKRIADIFGDTAVRPEDNCVRRMASAKPKIIAALMFLSSAQSEDRSDNVRILLLTFTDENTGYEWGPKYELSVHCDGEVVGCWTGTNVIPWFIDGDSSPDDHNNFPLIVKWKSICDFKARGLDSIFRPLRFSLWFSLKHVAFLPLRTIVGSKPEAFLWRADTHI